MPNANVLPQVIDNTMRTTFVSCPRKFYWEFIRKIGPSKTSIHLHFGACFAAGLETARLAFYEAGKSEADALHEGLLRILSEWGDYEPDERGNKNLPTCLLALEAYVEAHPFADDPIQPYITQNGKPAVEFTFAIPLDILHPGGEAFLYAGRFDMLGIYNNQLFVVDEKTTSQLGPSWMNSWDLRSQFTGYCWAAREHNLPVVGAVARGTCILAKEIKHADVITYRPDWQITRWYEQLHRDLARMVQAAEANTWDYSLADTCTAYGGCPYKRLCESPNPERYIPIYYTERTWNPLAADPLNPEAA